MREKVERGERWGESSGVRKVLSTYHHRVDQISTSFFITNFPEDLGWGDIWKIFVKYGMVSDVFIPKKVDKWGRKFGFVKFKEVRDVEDLSRRLDDVWYGTMKIMVKQARFRKGDQYDGSVKEKVEPAQRKRVALNVKVIEGVSFKSILAKGKEVNGVEEVAPAVEKKKNRLHSVEDLAPLELRVSEPNLRALEGSKVGFLKNTVDFNSFHERLLLQGHHEVKATQMGGNMVLLQSPCEGELAEVMRCNEAWWDFCFSKVLPWSPLMVSESRETWIQIFGIPLHAWEEGSFKALAGRFGVFLDFDEATIAKHRLDMARVKLRTVRRSLIDTVVQLLVMGRTFDVWVVEERCCCEEEGRVVEEEVFEDSSGLPSSNSGAVVWQGQKEDLFSDGTSESDKSEAEHYQALVDLHGKGDTKKVMLAGTSAVAVTKGMGKDNFPCQNNCEASIGVREDVEQVMVGQVEGLGVDTGMEIPRTEGDEVLGCSMDLVTVVRCTPGYEGDVLGSEEREAGMGGLNSNIVQVDSSGADTQIAAPAVNWNPFVDLCGDSALGLRDAGPVTVLSPDGIMKEACETEGGFIRDLSNECGGAQLELSNLSGSSQDVRSDGVIPIINKTHKKSKHSKPPLPLVGAPLSMRIALSERPASRRKKGEGAKKGSTKGQRLGDVDRPPILASSVSQEVVEQAFDLEVVLPFPGSGLNLLLNQMEGQSHTDVVGLGEDRVSEGEEVVKLLGIQKEVGFSFENNEAEVQNRLVDLEKVDRANNVLRVSEDGF
jgi:hypothetical protein